MNLKDPINNNLDFEKLKNRIRYATEKYFKESVEKYVSDICAFSLSSDDGAMTVVPSINITEHLRKVQKENPGYEDDYEFNLGEWFIDGGSSKEFDTICKSLYTELTNIDLNFEDFKRSLFGCSIQVLQELKAEDFFEKTAETENILILFSVTDTDESIYNQISWIKGLNYKYVTKRYEDWLKSCCE